MQLDVCRINPKISQRCATERCGTGTRDRAVPRSILGSYATEVNIPCSGASCLCRGTRTYDPAKCKNIISSAYFYLLFHQIIFSCLTKFLVCWLRKDYFIIHNQVLLTSTTYDENIKIAIWLFGIFSN